MLLETNYRERLQMVTNEVKKRLDYQVALQNLHRQMEKEHMVNWVEKSVVSSITPQQVSPRIIHDCLSLFTSDVIFTSTLLPGRVFKSIFPS